MKELFNKRLNLPRNNVTWNPEVLLRYIKTLTSNHKLTFWNVTIKTVALTLVLTGRGDKALTRCQEHKYDPSRSKIKVWRSP